MTWAKLSDSLTVPMVNTKVGPIRVEIKQGCVDDVMLTRIEISGKLLFKFTGIIVLLNRAVTGFETRISGGLWVAGEKEVRYDFREPNKEIFFRGVNELTTDGVGVADANTQAVLDTFARSQGWIS